MDQNEMRAMILENKDKLTTKQQGFLRGNAEVGSDDATFTGYAPVVCGIQLGEDWYESEDAAMAAGRAGIEWLENQSDVE